MKRHLPAFANETEEADWWYANREQLAKEFVQAGVEGQLVSGQEARRRRAEAAKARNLEIDGDDALTAATLALKKGVDVKRYLGELVHKALMDEVARDAA